MEAKINSLDVANTSVASMFMRLYSDKVQNIEISTSLISSVLQGVDLGDAFIPCSQDQAQALGDLVSFHDPKNNSAFYPEKHFVFGGHGLALSSIYHSENTLAHKIKQMIDVPVQNAEAFEQYKDLLSNEHQQKALKLALEKNLVMITGGAGTGKTYTLARIIAVLHKLNPQANIMMAAPTGKAAQRMKESLHLSFNDPQLLDRNLVTDTLRDITPITMHRLLGLGYKHKKSDEMLPYDIIVVDESSMLDLSLSNQLFSNLKPNCKVILLGDEKQLASVGLGFVLAELDSSIRLKDHFAKLVDSRRFSSDSLVGALASYVLEDHQIKNMDAIASDLTNMGVFGSMGHNDVFIENIATQEKTKHLKHVVCAKYQTYVDEVNRYLQGESNPQQVCTAFDEYRVLTTTNLGSLGVDELNDLIDSWVAGKTNQSAKELYIGKPIMVLQNDYTNGLANGDVGICLLDQDNELSIYFSSTDQWLSAKSLFTKYQSAYCMTIHKSQGSEYKEVTAILKAQGNAVVTKEMLYTAITRCKSKLGLYTCGFDVLDTALKLKTVRKSELAYLIDC